MKPTHLAGLCALAVLHCAAMPGFDEDFDAALTRARSAKRPLFVLFTGSDWCVWCKRLQSEVLSKSEFLDFATNSYELAVVDMPSDKSKQSAGRRRRNSELVAKYKVKGFPTVLLVDENEQTLYSAGYSRGGAKAWVDGFSKGVKLAPLKAKYLGRFEDRLKAVGEKFVKGMSVDGSNGGDVKDKKKFATLLKSMAGELLPEIVAISEDLESQALPDELTGAKDELSRQVAQARAALEAQSKMDVDVVVAEMEKAEKERKERPSTCSGRRVRHIALPRPADAKVGIDYFVSTAMPFYETRLVKTFVAPDGMKEAQAKAVLDVRRSLVRRLVTGREELPTGEECEAARALWNKKCRDAAVAIVHYLGMYSYIRNANGSKVFKEAVAAHDFAREPVLGFILTAYAFDHEAKAWKKNRGKGRKAMDEAAAACDKAFRAVVDVYKKADWRVFSEFSSAVRLPESVVEAYGDRYLLLFRRAYDDLNRAGEARGSRWARDVTEEGWKGWDRYNKSAESNLLAAVSLRPDDWQAPLLLSTLAGRASVSQGDDFSWFSAAVSNSLDGCAGNLRRFLLFQTSRWGGSTDFLRGFVMDCATNVDVRSTFSYRGAAVALRMISHYELDKSVQTDIFKRMVTPEVASALYGMFDAYAAAPESPFMPNGDIFRGMGMSLAIQLDDWKTVRRYWKSLKKPLRSYLDAHWLRKVDSGDGLRQRHQFEVLGRSKHAERFIDAAEMMAAGRLADAFREFDALQKIEKPFGAEKMLASGCFFELRKALQDREGGWVDIMPSAAGGEANNIGGMTYTDPDGRARCHGARQAYYRIHSPIPGMGVEIEGVVHFEKGDDAQDRWDIGWGLGRHFSCREASACHWSFPYVGFCRDDKGDHFSVQTPTRENNDRRYESPKDEARTRGWFSPFEVATGDLERKDSHAFAVRMADEMLVIAIDGKEVYRYPLDDMLQLEAFRDRIQPNGDVLPVWKIFKGTSFSGYRYRRTNKVP